MNVNHFIINVNSAQPEVLIDFYENVVGLTPSFDVTPGAFMAGSSRFIALIVEGHGEVNGGAKEPQRVLLNFVVDDVVAEQNRLRDQGVQFLRPASLEPGVGVFATFLDRDGNYCQVIELSH